MLRAVLTCLLLCAGALGAPSSAVAETPRADLIVRHARVRTMDDARPWAEAVAVRDGKILAVGDAHDINRLRGAGTQVLDAGGHVVLPAFIDTHMHPRPVFDEMSRYGELQVWPWTGAVNRDAFLAKLAAKAAITPKGELIVANGYADEVIGGHPLASDLDRVTPDHPLLVTHSSGHRLVANSMALRLAGITRDTPDPPGGKFVRDADGAPNGIVLETAMEPLRAALKRFGPGAPPHDQLLDAYRREFRGFMAYGLAGIADAWTERSKLDTYRDLLRSGMPVTVYAMIETGQLDWLIAHRNDAEWQVPGLTLRTVKVVAGNSFSGRTALLYEPYARPPNYYGLEPKVGPVELNAIALKAHLAGVQLAVHANGDREIDRVLDAVAAAQAAHPDPAARHRIEHASVMTAALLARTKALGVCLAPHSYILNNGEKLEDYGPDRFDWLEPNRRALDAGVCIGGTSDHPISPPNIMERVESLVTRRAASNGKVYGASQRLTVDEALRTFTMGGAYLQFEETVRGSITPGKRADLVVLGADPYASAPDAISDIRVEETIIAGKTVYDAHKSGDARFAW